MNEKIKFLIIDDDTEDCDFFCEAVNEVDASYDCLQMHNAEEALRELRAENHALPDFIFLDLNMPRMNGKEFLQEIKHDPVLKNIPVVVYTTSSSDKDIEDSKQLGAAYFLTKPSDFKAICREVAQITQRISRKKMDS